MPLTLLQDSYRLWETLLLGAIPIVESNAGMDKTYANLPVLVVRNYSDLNPKLLEKSYPCFVKNAHKFRYFHLTSGYWHKLVYRAVRTASAEHVLRNHPVKNLYCNFLE